MAAGPPFNSQDNFFLQTFDAPIDNLPRSLTHLTIAGEFNQPINRLPLNLTHLTLMGRFNQYLDNLPASLTHLVIGEPFKKPINRLPPKLRVFFGGKFKLKDLPQSADITFSVHTKEELTKHVEWERMNIVKLCNYHESETCTPHKPIGRCLYN